MSSVWSVPGIRLLAVLTFFGFSGYAVLLPTAPLWALRGGAGSAGAGLVNGVLLAATVATQLAVPTLLRRFGWGPVLAAGLALLAIGGALHPVSDALPYVLALAVTRGAGFGILTVTGSSAAGMLVPAHQRGAAIGAYGLAVAVPNLVLLPLGPVVVEQWGYLPVFAASALPALGIPFAAMLARQVHGDTAPGHSERSSTATVARVLVPPAMVLLGVTLAGGALLTFAAQLVTDARVATAALFLIGLVAAIARWLAGGLADRFGPGRFLLPLVLVTLVAMTGLAWAVQQPDLPGAALPLFLIATAGLGVSYGALQSLTLVASFNAVPIRQMHTASAVWNIGFDAGTAAGSVLVGLLASRIEFPAALLVAGALSVLTVPACLVIQRRESGGTRPA